MRTLFVAVAVALYVVQVTQRGITPVRLGINTVVVTGGIALALSVGSPNLIGEEGAVILYSGLLGLLVFLTVLVNVVVDWIEP